MHQTSSSHSVHDELLLARLYGDDVDEQERERALEQMASCTECADFLADLGAIARATAALPVPARPRDFTLTEADARRIGRPAPRSMFGWLKGTRGFARSMAAVGVAGFMVVGVITALTPPTRPTSGNAMDFAGGSPAMVAGPSEARGPQAATMAPAGASSETDSSSGYVSGSGATAAASALPVAITSPTLLGPVAPVATGGKSVPQATNGELAVGTAGAHATYAPAAPPVPATTSQPSDPGARIRLILLVVFAIVGLFGIGALILGRVRSRGAAR